MTASTIPPASRALLEQVEANLPQELLAEQRWVAWDRTPRKDGRPSKEPINARTGYGAKVNDATTFSTFAEASSAALRLEHAGGVGIVLTGGRWLGIDLDHVIDLATGELLLGARELLDALSPTYVECSVSGDGLHVLLRGRKPNGWRRQIKGAFGAGTALECYDGSDARYLICTGDVWNSAPIADASESDFAMLAAFLVPTKAKASATASRPHKDHHDDDDNLARVRFGLLERRLLDPDAGYDPWFKVGPALKTLFGDAGLDLWIDWSRSSVAFDEGEMRSKWSGLHGSTSEGALFGMFDEAAPGWRQQFSEAHQCSPSPRQATEDGRPSASVNIDEFHELLAFGLELLATQKDIASKDGRLVHVTRDENGDVLRTVELTHGVIRERLSRLALWLEDKGKNNPTPVHPPETVVVALAETRHAWPGIVNVANDDETPTRDWLDVAEDPSPPMIVERAVTAGGLVVFGGYPNAGKTALVLDMALRLCHGVSTWLGRELPEGGASTLYLAAEGVGGLGSRLRAWRSAHPMERPAPGRYFAIRSAVPNLAELDAAARLHEIVGGVTRQHDGAAPDLVIVDTWAAATPGADENDAGASGAALHALAVLQRAYGCAVIVLHHLRKPADSREPPTPAMHEFRGSSVLVGAADVALIARDGQLHTVKMRDGMSSAPSLYAITSHPTGRGDETGPVVLPAPPMPAPPTPEQAVEAERQRRVDRLATMEDAAVEALRRLGSAPNATTVVAEMTGRREDRFAAFNRAVTRGYIVDTGSSKKSRFVVPEEEGGVRKDQRTGPEPGTEGSSSAGAGGSGNCSGTDGNREPASIDEGLSEQPKGRRHRNPRKP